MKKKYYCKDCGREVSTKNTKRCSECWYKFNRGKNHPMFNKKRPDTVKQNKKRIGKKHPCYIDGRSLKKVYCPDCSEILINYTAKRCKSCEMKRRYKLGIFNPKVFNYKGGKPKCIDCGKEINYDHKRCYKCKYKNPRNHPNWQGGISFEEYPQEFNKELKESIRVRDNYTCQLCGCPEVECGRKLSIHHIDYNKQNCNDNNLIVLCQRCNVKVNYNRDYWENYFKKGGK